MIKKILEQNVDLQQFLFIRGFLATNRNNIDLNEFPFYGNWEMIKVQDLFFYKHNQAGFHFCEEGDKACFLFGHAYNPFTMEINENKILERIFPYIGTKEIYEYVDELTGIFVFGTIEKNKISFLVDPSGMQSACYCVDGKDFYISSHAQLLADICGYEMDPFVKELITYKWYTRVMGPYLPADMTPYVQAKRIVPNIAYLYDIDQNAITHERFYPLRDLSMCKTDEEYNAVIQEAADILKSNMSLVVQKWNNPWQSLTGGIDSNTTFAAANGHYDKIKTFSYCSAEKETIDCEAAKIISEKFSVDWTLFNIPNDNDQIERFDEKREIIRHNNGYIGLEKDNELRKRMILQEQCSADVEIKSWTSETIRAYWYKHYGRKKMPKLSAKLYRNLYKIFITNRKLAHKIDKIFAEYIAKFEYKQIPSQYPPADMHYNEVTWGSWGGMNISEMKYCFDITIIYNNRRFLDLLFRVPLEKRISDQHHLDMKKYLNKELFDMNIRVVNMRETKFRAFALNLIFTINSWLPF